MRVLGVIPARAGSKSIPRKNLAMLCGRPLIEWTIEAARLSRLLERTVVSTDDDAIFRRVEVLHRAKMEAIQRSERLATDTAKTLHVLQSVLYECEPIHNAWYDAVFCLQPTNPMRSFADIDGAIALMESTNCDSVISFTPCNDAHPARMCQLDGDKVPPQDFTRRQDLPPYYLRDGSVYLVKREVLMAGSMVGNDCRAWIIPPERSCNIDSMRDLALAEVLMRNQCAS